MENETKNSTSYEVSFHNSSNYVTIYAGENLSKAFDLFTSNLNKLNSTCKDDNSDYELELMKKVDGELEEFTAADFTDGQRKLLNLTNDFYGWIIEGNFDANKAPMFNI